MLGMSPDRAVFVYLGALGHVIISSASEGLKTKGQPHGQNVIESQ